MRPLRRLRFALALAVVGLGLLALGAATTASAAVTVTFSFTGAAQTFLVPAGVTSITVDACGDPNVPGRLDEITYLLERCHSGNDWPWRVAADPQTATPELL